MNPAHLVVPMRPIREGDGPALQRFHSRQSSESIYRRFFQLVPRLSEELAHYFTHLDGLNRHAEIALNPNDPTEIIGVVRYDRDAGTDLAEYAIIIDDAWHHHGIGDGLTRQLIRVALANGVRRFYAFVLPENRAMIGLFEHLGVPIHMRSEDGVFRVELDLAAEARAADPPGAASAASL